MYQRGELGLFVANDSTEDFLGGFEYGVKKFNGTVVKSQSGSLRVSAGGVVRIDPILGKGDYLYANVGEGLDKTVFHINLFANNSWKTDLETAFVKSVAEGIIIRIKAKSFARCVFIDFPKPLLCSDNYFDMEQGEEREILLEGLSADDYPSIVVKTFADEWKE